MQQAIASPRVAKSLWGKQLTLVDVGGVGLLAGLGPLLLLARGRGLLAGILLLGSLGGSSRGLGGGLLVGGLGGHFECLGIELTMKFM